MVLQAIAVIMRILLGLLFAFAGFIKLHNVDEFRKSIMALGISNETGALWLARLIPYSEIALGIWLVFGIEPKFSAAGLFLLVFAFTAILVVALIRGLKVSCGCFGRISKGLLTWKTVARNISFAVVCALVFVLPAAQTPAASYLVPASSGGTALGPQLLLALTIVCGLALVARFAKIREHFWAMPQRGSSR